MDEILKNLLSPAWFFSTMVMAVLMNITSHYITKYIDFRSAKSSKERSLRLEAKRVADVDRLRAAVSSSEERLAEYFGMLVAHIKSSFFSLQALAFTIMALVIIRRADTPDLLGVTTLLVAISAFVVSMVGHKMASKHQDRAMETEALLTQARRLISEENKRT